MKNQVLSIEQMQELIKLGIDTSNASMCWLGCSDGNAVYPYDSTFKDIFEQHKETIPAVLTPAFTLQDILSTLPQFITKDNYFWSLQSDGIEYIQLQVGNKLEADLGFAMKYVFKGCYDYNDEPDILNCAFDMLKWCKENNYI